jgi:hypothetical protein
VFAMLYMLRLDEAHPNMAGSYDCTGNTVATIVRGGGGCSSSSVVERLLAVTHCKETVCYEMSHGVSVMNLSLA